MRALVLAATCLTSTFLVCAAAQAAGNPEAPAPAAHPAAPPPVRPANRPAPSSAGQSPRSRPANTRVARPLAHRSAKVVMRAYESTARSIPRKAATANESGERARNALWHVDKYDAEEPVSHGMFKEPTYKFRAGVVDRLEQALSSDVRTAGLFDKSSFSGESGTTRASKLGALVDKAVDQLRTEHPDVATARTKMQAFENHLQERLDAQFVKNRPAFKRELASADPQKLYDYALTLVHNINDAVNAKDIRSETVAQGQASGSSSVDGVQRGMLGGVKAEVHGSSSFAASYHGEQLVLDGSTYKVVVRGAGSAAESLRDPNVVLPVKARLIAEMAIEVSDVTRTLEQKQPKLAIGLSHWLNHSKIEFMTEGGTRPVELSRASSDVVQNLGGTGIATATMVSTLRRETSGTMLERFDSHPFVGH